jgi:hypothetical protein
MMGLAEAEPAGASGSADIRLPTITIRRKQCADFMGGRPFRYQSLLDEAEAS